MKPLIAIAVLSLAGLFVELEAATSFQVNTHTTGSQRTPDVTMTSDGRFVIVWASGAQDGSGLGIFGQLFDPPAAAGALPTPVGAEFQVNTHITLSQETPRVASDGSGGFVVVWRSVDQDGDRGGVFGRRFGGNGSPVGGEFAINSTTTGDQLFPDVAGAGNGEFVVVWQTKDSAATLSPVSIMARRFDDAGVPLGSEFTVSTETRASLVLELSPTVAMNADGLFVVAWGRPSAGGLYPRLYARIYESSGQPVGDEFAVGPPFAYDYQPRAGMDDAGEFVVVWGSGLDFGMYYGTYARRFEPNGTAKGSEFLIDDSFLFDGPDVSAAGGGSFVVTWADDKVRASRFDAAGNPEGNPLIVDDGGSSAAVGMDDTRSFVVTWARDDGSETGIFGWRFGCPGEIEQLQVETTNGVNNLLLTWSDSVDAADYLAVEDVSPAGSFLTETGTAASGSMGLVIPMPPGDRFYLVAGRNGPCGLGTLN